MAGNVPALKCHRMAANDGAVAMAAWTSVCGGVSALSRWRLDLRAGGVFVSPVPDECAGGFAGDDAVVRMQPLQIKWIALLPVDVQGARQGAEAAFHESRFTNLTNARQAIFSEQDSCGFDEGDPGVAGTAAHFGRIEPAWNTPAAQVGGGSGQAGALATWRGVVFWKRVGQTPGGLGQAQQGVVHGLADFGGTFKWTGRHAVIITARADSRQGCGRQVQATG